MTPLASKNVYELERIALHDGTWMFMWIGEKLRNSSAFSTMLPLLQHTTCNCTFLTRTVYWRWQYTKP